MKLRPAHTTMRPGEAAPAAAGVRGANPGLLEEVLRQFTISRQVDQITKKPMLILLDETVQQVRVAPAETASNCAGIGFHRIRVAISYGVHATRIYGRGGKKDAGWETFSYSALGYLY